MSVQVQARVVLAIVLPRSGFGDATTFGMARQVAADEVNDLLARMAGLVSEHTDASFRVVGAPVIDFYNVKGEA